MTKTEAAIAVAEYAVVDQICMVCGYHHDHGHVPSCPILAYLTARDDEEKSPLSVIEEMRQVSCIALEALARIEAKLTPEAVGPAPVAVRDAAWWEARWREIYDHSPIEETAGAGLQRVFGPLLVAPPAFDVEEIAKEVQHRADAEVSRLYVDAAHSHAMCEVIDYIESVLQNERLDTKKLIAAAVEEMRKTSEDAPNVRGTTTPTATSSRAEIPKSATPSPAPDFAAMAHHLADVIWNNTTNEFEQRTIAYLCESWLKLNWPKPAPVAVRDEAWWRDKAEDFLIGIPLGQDEHGYAAAWLRATFGQDPAAADEGEAKPNE